MNRNRCLRGVAVFLGALIVLFTMAIPGYSYQRVIFDAHTHSEYSDEGLFTKNRVIQDMAENIQKTLGSDQEAVMTGFTVTYRRGQHCGS